MQWDKRVLSGSAKEMIGGGVVGKDQERQRETQSE